MSFLKGVPFKDGFYGSKASGEPPLILSMGVNFAIQAAVKAAREEGGKGDVATSHLTPLTVEKSQSACKVSQPIF